LNTTNYLLPNLVFAHPDFTDGSGF